MVYIAFDTELKLQICNYAQKQHICRENSNYAPDENFTAIFAIDEKLPTSVTLASCPTISQEKYNLAMCQLVVLYFGMFWGTKEIHYFWLVVWH